MVKGELSLCLTKHDATKMFGGVEVQLHAFLVEMVFVAKLRLNKTREGLQSFTLPLQEMTVKL
jgi:hypothetical protein